MIVTAFFVLTIDPLAFVFDSIVKKISSIFFDADSGVKP